VIPGNAFDIPCTRKSTNRDFSPIRLKPHRRRCSTECVFLHGLRVYSEKADALVREIDQLGGRDEVADLLWREFDNYKNPDVKRLELVLTQMRDGLLGL